MAVAVTAIALKASIVLTLSCVLPFVLLLCWKRLWSCAVIALCFLLVAVGFRHHYVLPAQRADGKTDVLQGRVVETSTYGRMYTVEIAASRHLPVGSRVMLYCLEEDLPLVGDTVTANVELKTVKDNQTYYASRLAFVCAFPDDEEGSLQVVHAHQREGFLQRTRTALVREVRQAMPTRESGVLTALCFGDRAFLHDQDADAFRHSGLSHLLVVSGLHLSLVSLAVRRLFRRLGMVPCCAVTLCVTWLFALFVGATPSIVRAAVMLSLWLVGCLVLRRSDGLNNIGLAALILLAANPYTLWNVGFQLSFAATAGVLLLAPRRMPQQEPQEDDLPWHTRLCRWLRHGTLSILAVSFSALLFSLPIACYHYGGFPIASLPANLLAAPVAGVTMLFGWLGAVCGTIPCLGWLSNGLLLVAGLLARYLRAIAQAFDASWNWGTLSQHWVWVLLTVLCGVTAYGIRCRISRRRVAAVLMSITVLALGIGLPLTAAPLRVTVVSVDNQCGLILQQGRHCALIITDPQDMDEVVYETPAFDPEVVVVLGGNPSALTQMNRWPQAKVVVAAPTDWTGGTQLSITPCGVGETIQLWQGCRLTRLTDGWTAVQAADQAIGVGTDLTTPCPDPEAWPIYVGGVPASPPDGNYMVVCTENRLLRQRPVLTGRETIPCGENGDNCYGNDRNPTERVHQKRRGQSVRFLRDGELPRRAIRPPHRQRNGGGGL